MSNKIIVNGVDVFEELEKKEKLLGLYRDYFFVVEQKYNITNSENIKTELAIKIKELESDIEK
jgi:hypothetical protein